MNIKDYINQNTDELMKIFRELCLIPAPSHMEEKRALYCENYLKSLGAEGVYTDDAKNVVYPMNCDGCDDITVFVAHTDTVFPDLESLPYREEGGKVFCPGCGDDTASLTILLFTVKYFIENAPLRGVMFVCNSCEEGLGNLKGTRKIFEDYDGRIARFISLDGAEINNMATRCVGSHRYNVTVKTPGGHSYGSFGNKNAIAELSKIINAIYSLEVPHIGSSKTTYNVGVISGGTSVNTIAQEAQVLCEYRSDDAECLAIMQKKFEKIFAAANEGDVSVSVEKIGDRPCMGDVDEALLSSLIADCRNTIQSISPGEVKEHSSSTDCNIPLSLGVPAVCIGVYNGGGTHTREEWLFPDSMPTGLEVAITLAEKIGEKIK